MQPQDIYFKYFSRKQHILTPFIGVIYSRQVGSSWQSRECSRNESRTAIYNRNFRFSHASVSGKEDQATGNTHHITYYHDHSVHQRVWCEWLLFHVCGCCIWKNNSSRGELWNFQISAGIYQCLNVSVG